LSDAPSLSRRSCQNGAPNCGRWELPATDPDGTDRTENRIDSDRADDSADPNGTDGTEDRIDSDRADDSTDPNGTDGTEDRIDSDRADDSTDPNGTDGTEDRIDDRSDVGNTAERDRVPDPTDAAVSKVRRGAGRRGEHRKGKCTRNKGNPANARARRKRYCGTAGTPGDSSMTDIATQPFCLA
jgi:hypothetical protein